jgi:hypothetical protein
MEYNEEQSWEQNPVEVRISLRNMLARLLSVSRYYEVMLLMALPIKSQTFGWGN